MSEPAPPQAADDCLFCRIVAGEIPATLVYEDDAAVAFLDVAPLKPGHTLVVPRRHVTDLTTDAEVLSEVAPAVSHVAAQLKQQYEADGVSLLQNSGAAAGQEVFHLHVHLVPRHEDDGGIYRLIRSE